MKIRLQFFKDRRLVILTLVNLLMLLVFGLVIWLAAERNTAIRFDYQTLSQFTANQENWRRIVATWSATAAPRSVIGDYFVTPASLPIFIEQLESLAAASAVDLRLTAVEITPEPAVWLQINFTALGGLDDLTNFWTLVDNLPALITVQRLQFEDRSSLNSADAWSLTASLRLFNFQNQNHEN